MRLFFWVFGLGLVALITSCATTPVATRVELGNEMLAKTNYAALSGKRVGLITNPSGVNRDLVSTVDLLRRAPGVKLEALFGPEHGIYGDVAAGEKVKDASMHAQAFAFFHSMAPRTAQLPKCSAA